jgi:selenocysteine lyase/cysteine desulfurase
MKSRAPLSDYFQKFRDNIVGIEEVIETPIGAMPLVYTDWTASGRLYEPIERKILEEFGPFMANSHTTTTTTGNLITMAYHQARQIVKKHVGATDEDILIFTGHGMTGAVNKLQRILGLKLHEFYKNKITLKEEERPIVFITHMEHHSNQTSWLETMADVEIIPYLNEKDLDFEAFEKLLEKYKNRNLKIASVTACSNVTGLKPDYSKVARMIHNAGGYMFVDFACSAPYVDIDMHPENEEERLDAIFFSPHKFLGGPGANGVLIFNRMLYVNKIPDNPGGGTVLWTNPWKEHRYFDDPEVREDGGTPGILQAIRTALAIELKEQMGVNNILNREHEILSKLIPAFKSIENLNLLAGDFEDRLGVLSFVIDGLPYNLGVRLLNDHFGIQTRGGCSCAGTYGHILFGIDKKQSHEIIKEVESGNEEAKPGWIRLSIHPTTSDEEVAYIIRAIKALAENFPRWKEDYLLQNGTYVHKKFPEREILIHQVNDWFRL